MTGILRMAKALVPVLALTILTACDDATRRDLAAERVSKAYQAAMADLRAGRVEEAVRGFERQVREDPGNASARFQLACALQDARHDYVGAFCAFREYMLQQPKSEKAKLANDRADLCEREAAKVLAAKYGFDSGAGAERAADALRQELSETRARAEKAESDVVQAMRRIASLRMENERLMAVIRDGVEATPAPLHANVAEANALLEDDDEEIRVDHSADVAALRREGEAELAEEASSLLPEQAPDAKARRAAAEEAERKAREARLAARRSREPAHEPKPDTYVVQEGDTLTRIAIRFYGRPSRWQAIREANKAVVSMDGRVKAGERLVLP